MSSSLIEIMKLLPPPAEPQGLDRSWEEVEEDLGCVLPADYKGFIDQYGSGQICEWIDVWNLRDKSLFPPPLQEVICGPKGIINFYQKLNEEYDILTAGSWTTFPEPGGLLPFCTAFEIDYLNWRIAGPADEWDCVYWFFDGNEFIHLEGDSFTDFLQKVLKRQYNQYQLPTVDEPYQFTQ
ncbi:MAG: SMI1/KNR4 family protein [Gimesia chilikensis]|uniref:SMI1/KNR4 family protein n=1 Tax=Gimesia chilikensis TaxID=2605989 RepID=UPI003789E990